MAVSLSLKAVIDLGQAPYYPANESPGKHFRTLFVPLYGLPAAAYGSPVDAVERIAAFLRVLVSGSRYLQVRLRRFLWARRTLRRFLGRAVQQRHRRLRGALLRWEASERGQEEADPPACPPSPSRGKGEPRRLRAVPRAMKATVLTSLYRSKLQGLLLNCRSGIRHRHQLAADLKAVSCRIADLWLTGQHRSLEVQQLTARLFGLRQRVQSYRTAPIASLEEEWEAVGVPQWEARLLELKAKDENWANGFFVDLAEVDALQARKQAALGHGGSLGPESPHLRRKYVEAVEKAMDIEGVSSHVRRLQNRAGALDVEPVLVPRIVSFTGALRAPKAEDTSPRTRPTSPTRGPPAPAARPATPSPPKAPTTSPPSPSRAPTAAPPTSPGPPGGTGSPARQPSPTARPGSPTVSLAVLGTSSFGAAVPAVAEKPKRRTGPRRTAATTTLIWKHDGRCETVPRGGAADPATPSPTSPASPSSTPPSVSPKQSSCQGDFLVLEDFPDAESVGASIRMSVSMDALRLDGNAITESPKCTRHWQSAAFRDSPKAPHPADPDPRGATQLRLRRLSKSLLEVTTPPHQRGLLCPQLNVEALRISPTHASASQSPFRPGRIRPATRR